MSNFRSNLFIPGHTLDRLERGQKSNADAIIVDLEDGCPEAEKLVARETLIDLLREKAFSLSKSIKVSLATSFSASGQPSSKSTMIASALLFCPLSRRSKVWPGINRLDLKLLITNFFL